MMAPMVRATADSIRVKPAEPIACFFVFCLIFMFWDELRQAQANQLLLDLLFSLCLRAPAANRSFICRMKVLPQAGVRNNRDKAGTYCRGDSGERSRGKPGK